MSRQQSFLRCLSTSLGWFKDFVSPWICIRLVNVRPRQTCALSGPSVLCVPIKQPNFFLGWCWHMSNTLTFRLKWLIGCRSPGGDSRERQCGLLRRLWPAGFSLSLSPCLCLSLFLNCWYKESREDAAATCCYLYQPHCYTVTLLHCYIVTPLHCYPVTLLSLSEIPS